MCDSCNYKKKDNASFMLFHFCLLFASSEKYNSANINNPEDYKREKFAAKSTYSERVGQVDREVKSSRQNNAGEQSASGNSHEVLSSILQNLSKDQTTDVRNSVERLQKSKYAERYPTMNNGHSS